MYREEKNGINYLPYLLKEYCANCRMIMIKSKKTLIIVKNGIVSMLRFFNIKI